MSGVPDLVQRGLREPAGPPAATPADAAPKLGIRPAGDEEIKPDMSQVSPELAKVFEHYDRQIFELTGRPWVSCWNSDLIEDVNKSALGPACDSGNFTSTEARIEISRYCQTRGFGAGIIQELGAGTLAHIHCFQPASSTTWKLRP